MAEEEESGALLGVVDVVEEENLEIVSDADLEFCINILQKLGEHKDHVNSHPHYRALRRAMFPFLDCFERMEKTYEYRKRKKEWVKQKQEADKEALNAAAMRAHRLKEASEIMQKLALTEGKEEEEKKMLMWTGTSEEGAKEEEEKKKSLLLENGAGAAAEQQESSTTTTSSSNAPEAIQLTFSLIPDGPANVTVSSEEDKDSAKQPQLNFSRKCHICIALYTDVHPFYGDLCPKCAEENYRKRLQTCDLNGRIAIVTGGRVKIGFQTSLKLLRAGATVVVTTRFPADCMTRYEELEDYLEFKDRLFVYALDMRDISSVEHFAKVMCDKFSHLDILINNACQTVRRPPDFYKHMIDREKELVLLLEGAEGGGGEKKNTTVILDSDENGDDSSATANQSQQEEGEGDSSSFSLSVLEEERLKRIQGLHSNKKSIHPALLSQARLGGGVDDDVEKQGGAQVLFPTGGLDVAKQQIDLRTKNSWTMIIGEVTSVEAAEVFAINALAPFILNGKLQPLFEKSPFDKKFIVNVSAMEGKFYRFKTAYHPHTNMAKAALNMMTRTCAFEMMTKGIFMNSVDTGWINDENPLHIAAAKHTRLNFQTPLDEIDAAARIVDPVFACVNGEKPIFGQFLKDYKETKW